MTRITRPETPLKRALREEGRMQIWLAETVGCDPSDISNYVRGLHVPAEPRRSQIARALHRTTEDLFGADRERSAA